MAKRPKKQQLSEPNYPRVTARVSSDEAFTPGDMVKNYLRDISYVSAKVPFEVFDIIDNMVLTDPYVSRYHQTTVSLAHTGHYLSIRSASKRKAQKAIEICNDFARRCFPLAGGMVGLISTCFSQLARTNATCVEFPPDSDMRSVSQAFPVPIKSLRFQTGSDGSYILCQNQNVGIVPLNPSQTFFYNAMVRDGNPYPIPPIVAAIEPCAIHRSIINQVKDWMNKLSALGVMIAEVEPPPRSPGETQQDYDDKARAYLTSIANSITNNMSSGLAVGYNNVKFTFQNTQASASGARDILQMVLLGLFASLQRDPAMFGWNIGNSDSFVKVIYEEFTQTLGFYQQGVRRAIEFGHRLNLAMHGMSDCSVEAGFTATRSLDEFRDAEAAYMRTQKTAVELEKEIISKEEARINLGYNKDVAQDGAYIAKFSKTDNKYSLIERKIFSMYNGSTKQNNNDSYYEELLALMLYAHRQGLGKLLNWLDDKGNFLDDDVVLNALTRYIDAVESNIEDDSVIELASPVIESAWAAGKQKLGLDDKSIISSDELAALSYLTTVIEPWAVKKYLSRSLSRQDRISKFLKQEISENYENPSVFRSNVDSYLSNVATDSARKISDTTRNRAESWASVFGLDSDGVTRFRVDGPDDERTCDYCREMLGREFSVRNELENIMAMTNSEDPDELEDFLTGRYERANILTQLSSETIQQDGSALPPYHVKCRHYLTAIR